MGTKVGLRTGTRQRNNSSGLPGIRARWVKRPSGKHVAQIDVFWYEGLQRKFNTYPCTLNGLRQAMAKRESASGIVYSVSSREAFVQLVGTLPTKPGDAW